MKVKIWITALVMAMTVAGCGDSGVAQLEAPSSGVAQGAVTISCLDYSEGILPFIEVTTSLFEAYGLIVAEAADGTISFATAAALSADVTEGFELVKEGVGDLGTPPSGVARSVRLFQQAMDEVIKGSRLTTRMFATGSFDRLDEALAFIDKGTSLFYQSADAIPAGGC